MVNKFSMVTTFHQAGYDLYGKNMLESFDKYYPDQIDLHVYYEGNLPEIRSDRIHYYSYKEHCPEFYEFEKRNKDRKYPPGFRYQAVRFAHKPYAILSHLKNCDSQYTIWCDADTVAIKPIPYNFIKSLVHRKAYMSCLLRTARYTECGFYILDTHHKYHNEFIDRFVNKMYSEDLLFNEREWHDSWIFDVVHLQMVQERKIRVYDLSNGIDCAHPFAQGPLGEYLDHLKGKRKNIGSSPERKAIWT